MACDVIPRRSSDRCCYSGLGQAQSNCSASVEHRAAQAVQQLVAQPPVHVLLKRGPDLSNEVMADMGAASVVVTASRFRVLVK